MSAYSVSTQEKDPSKFALAIQGALNGRSNATGIVSLAAGSATTTTVPAINCAPGSRVFLFPASANGAAVVATTFVLPGNVSKQQFIISHAANVLADRTFFFVCLG